MRILWFGSAKDSTKEARSEATQSERLFRDSMRLSRHIEKELRDLGKMIPPGTHVAEYRHLEGQMQLAKTYAARTRDHLVEVEKSIKHLESGIKQARAMGRARAAEEHRRAA